MLVSITKLLYATMYVLSSAVGGLTQLKCVGVGVNEVRNPADREESGSDRCKMQELRRSIGQESAVQP